MKSTLSLNLSISKLTSFSPRLRATWFLSTRGEGAPAHAGRTVTQSEMGVHRVHAGRSQSEEGVHRYLRGAQSEEGVHRYTHGAQSQSEKRVHRYTQDARSQSEEGVHWYLRGAQSEEGLHRYT